MRGTVIFALAIATAAPALADSVIATRTLRPQTVLTADDIRLDAAEIEGAHASIEDVLGKETRVAIYAGRPVMRGALGEPALVEHNAIVELVFERGGLRIVAEGRALGRAGVGERIRVMNVSSRTTLFGTVAPDGTVVVSQ